MAKEHGRVDDVLTAYADREPLPRLASHGNVKHDGKVLTSYGVPVGRWLTDNLCLVNVDNIGGTGWGTINHNWRLSTLLNTNRYDEEKGEWVHNEAKAVQVSARLLEQHGCNFLTSDIRVLEVTRDVNERASSAFDPEEFATFEADIRAKYGTLGTLRKTHVEHGYLGAGPSGPKYGPYDEIEFHLAGGSLIMADGKLLWSAFEEGQYFCCEINQDEYYAVSQPNTNPITLAQRSLCPEELRTPEGDIMSGVVRQGEFFFAPAELPEPITSPRQVLRWYRLSDKKVTGFPNMGQRTWYRYRGSDDNTAHHTAHFATVTKAGRTLVAGYVKDRQHGYLVLQSGLKTIGPYRPSRYAALPHTRKLLSSLSWFEPYHNTQLASYSAEGIGVRID